MSVTEDALCLTFAERVKESAEFASWVLNRTKFGKYPGTIRLLHQEQMSIRPRKFWWRHWWCEFPGQKKRGGEIDIFMVFEIAGTKRRFALHIENKKSNGKFEEGQPEGYSLRARHMANKSEYLNYQDYETVLIAPVGFRDRFGVMCGSFGAYISYEDIAQFVPEFGIA